MSPSSPICLVTGGAGFIGSALVRGLLDRGCAVRVFDDLSTGRAENLAGLEGRVEFIRGDVRDAAALRGAVRGADSVFHLAAIASVQASVDDPLATHDVNVTGTVNALIAARDAGVRRFVFTSSSAVYGDSPEMPKRESMAPAPMTGYALSKLAGEHYGNIFRQLYGLPFFALRYFNVFGPRQNPASHYAAVVPLFIRACLEGRRPVIYGDGLQTRDFTYVEDIVSANLCCMDAPDAAIGSVCNVAYGERIGVLELAQKIAAISGATFEPDFQPARPGDIRDSQADSTLARTVLGWEPSWTFDAGLRRTIDWYRQE
jgi:nucleoside-diphosphate-sugar epimerase